MATVSIILPTYNRAAFLPEAFESIRNQQFADWELIVVDDGSTDNTRELVADLTRSISQPVRYIYQENQGAYGARNTGLDHAKGKYVAFYDSDDIWLPHHLADCVAALEANCDVDWVYGACRMVDFRSGSELAANTFYVNGQARPFMGLRSVSNGTLRIIEDVRAARCQILQGLYCGLQNSVIRRRVFDNYRFGTDLRNEAEDQIIVIWALASGFKFAYFDRVHTVYQTHDANSSLSGGNKVLEKRLRLQLAIVEGFERLAKSGVLRPSERRALKRRLSEEYFWHVGYSLLWMNGRRSEAKHMYRRGLALWPWNWRYWKVFALAIARSKSPKRLRHLWWWISDAKWRHERRTINNRIARYHRLQRQAIRAIVRQTGNSILKGPFRSVVYTPATKGDFCAHVLLGTYEQELHDVLHEICGRNYETIIDIGVSEGYYLCGLALRSRAKRVVGFELDVRKHRGIKQLAQANGVEQRIELLGMCDAEGLARVLQNSGRTLIICDVDGAETEILDPKAVPLLSHVDILVETHDLLRPGITECLGHRFGESHCIEQIDSQRRSERDLPTSVSLSGELARNAMDEFRGGQQSWLWMQSKAGCESIGAAQPLESAARVMAL